MSAILVQIPGLFTTVQDLGREGFGPIGVSASGAADPVSLRIGNRLVGNPQGAAGLEMTLVGGAFAFEQAAVIAVTGADFGPSLDGIPVAMWTSIEIHKGQTVTLGPSRSGARAYLCIQGGIDVEPFLGSASTHVLSGLGGFEGRPLRRGDRLELGAANSLFHKGSLSPKVLESLQPRKLIRLTGGPQSDWFPFVEQQTTGGYPKIANVISADLHSLGQLRPRDAIRFERIEMSEARSLLIHQEELMASKELFQE